MILLRNADVYAPDALGEQDLLIGGDRIVAMAPYLSPPSADWPVTEIDLSGMLLLPGLIDGHTHLTGGGGEGGAETRVPAVQLSELSRAGVTTAIGLLGTDCSTRSIAELLAVARGLESYGLSAFCFTGGYMLPPPTLTGSVRGDIVHIDRIIGVGEVAISDHRSSQPTDEELARLASDAHVAGMMTKKAGILHLHLGDGPRGLAPIRRLLDQTELPPRVFHPTHVNRNRRLWEEAKALSERGCFIDVTAFDADGDGLLAGEAIAEYLEAGLDPARITLSSDGGGCLPTFNKDGVLTQMGVGSSANLLETVASLLDRGVELPAALAPCTANVASLYRLHDRGRLRVGHRADIVAVNHDLRPQLVIAGGRVLLKDGKPTVRGHFERRH